MSKAEERGGTYALHKASEKLHDYYGNAMLGVVQFDGYDIKNAYIDGYHHAEKDLELAVEDIIIILSAEVSILREFNCSSQLLIKAYPKEEDYCGEILKRFKERKGNTNGE